MQSHIEVAATRGMKAGYKQYRERLSRSGLPQAKEILSKIEGMSGRAAFAWYCAKHGPDVAAIQSALSASEPIGVEVEADEPQGLTAEIAEARKRLAELEAQLASVQEQPKPRRRKPAQAKASEDVRENLWREWAVRKHNIPTKVGAKFSYKGKRRTSVFQVTRVTSEGVYSVRVS